MLKHIWYESNPSCRHLLFFIGQYSYHQCLHLQFWIVVKMFFQPMVKLPACHRTHKVGIDERIFYKNMGDAMTSETESFCISVGTAITHATGGKNNAAQHDRVMTREKIEACIETCTQAILDQFDTVDQLNEYDFESSRGSKRLDDQITMRLGLPMFLSLMDRFNIKEIHVSGTGLWYGIYLQHLHNIADN